MGLLLKTNNLESLYTFEYAHENNGSSSAIVKSSLNSTCYNKLLKKIEYYLAYVAFLNPQLEKYILIQESPVLNCVNNIVRRNRILWKYQNLSNNDCNPGFKSCSTPLVLISNLDPKAVIDLPDELFDPSLGNISVFALHKDRVDLLHYQLSSGNCICIKDFLLEEEVFINIDLGNREGYFESVTVKSKTDLNEKIKGYNKVITKGGYQLIEKDLVQ